MGTGAHTHTEQLCDHWSRPTQTGNAPRFGRGVASGYPQPTVRALLFMVFPSTPPPRAASNKVLERTNVQKSCSVRRMSGPSTTSRITCVSNQQQKDLQHCGRAQRTKSQLLSENVTALFSANLCLWKLSILEQEHWAFPQHSDALQYKS